MKGIKVSAGEEQQEEAGWLLARMPWVDLMHCSNTSEPHTRRGVSLHQTQPGTVHGAAAVFNDNLRPHLPSLLHLSRGWEQEGGIHRHLLNLRAWLTIDCLNLSGPTERSQPWSCSRTQEHNRSRPHNHGEVRETQSLCVQIEHSKCWHSVNVC